MRSGLPGLFELGSEATASAVGAGRAQYQRLQRGRPEDSRIDYAYGVVLIGQHRYADALPLVSRFLQTGQGEPHAYCVKIWVLLQLRRYGEALDDAVALSERFPKAQGAPPVAQFHEAAEFLGTVFGYLELARSTAIESKLRLERKNRVLARLGPAYTEAFDLGREAVGTQLSEFTARREAERNEVVAKAVKLKDRAKAALDKDSDKMLSEKETMQSSLEQLRDAQREFSQIQSELGTLNQERSKVAGQIAFTQALISELLTPVLFDQTSATSNGPLQINAAPRSFDSARPMQATALAISLARYNRQAVEMDRKIMVYRARAAELAGKGAQETAALAESEAEVASLQKRTKNAEYQLKRQEKPAIAHTGALSEKMSTFSTYSPFPYAQERQRVLGWFAK